MSLPNNVTSISLSICLPVHSPKLYFPLLQSSDVPSSCRRESELAPVFSKTPGHRFVCLFPPQSTTFCKLLSLPSHIVLHSLLLFDKRFNHSSVAITTLPAFFFLFFFLKQHLIIQQEYWGNRKFIVFSVAFVCVCVWPYLSACLTEDT